MLFSYSPVGFHDNWLHDTLRGMLIADLDRIDSGQAPLAWPHSISAARRKALKARHGLRSRRQSLLDAYQALEPHERVEVRRAMARQDEIPAVFGDGLFCPRLDQLPQTVREPIKDLFEFAFSILSDLGLRDQNYTLLYDQLRYKVCAFCGVEILDAPRQKREALDHYLPITIYPFAGANFRNLSPMGAKCNSRYKGKQDIICDAATGLRRLCCDPYESPELLLSLNESKPFEGAKVGQVICPEWDIQWIGGDPAKMQTWEAVFGIEERYRESSLNPNFRDWIDHFGQWAARKLEPLNTVASIREALLEFSEIIVPEGLADSAFLKRAAVKMLAHRCDESDGGTRLAEWLSGFIEELRLLPPVATQGPQTSQSNEADDIRGRLTHGISPHPERMPSPSGHTTPSLKPSPTAIRANTPDNTRAIGGPAPTIDCAPREPS